MAKTPNSVLKMVVDQGLVKGDSTAVEVASLVIESSILLGVGFIVGVLIIMLIISHILVSWSMEDTFAGDNVSESIGNMTKLVLILGVQISGFYGPLKDKLLGNVKKHGEIRSNAMWMNFTMITGLLSSIAMGLFPGLGFLHSILSKLTACGKKRITNAPMSLAEKDYERKSSRAALRLAQNAEHRIQETAKIYEDDGEEEEKEEVEVEVRRRRPQKKNPNIDWDNLN